MHKIWSQCLVWQRITGESTGETQPNLLSKSHSTQLPIQDKRAKSSGFDTEVLVFLSTRDLLRGKLFKSETQETNTASDEWIAALKSAKQEERHQQAQKPSGREGWEGENEHLKLKCKKKFKKIYMILNYPDSRGWTETGAGAEVGKLEYLASIHWLEAGKFCSHRACFSLLSLFTKWPVTSVLAPTSTDYQPTELERRLAFYAKKRHCFHLRSCLSVWTALLVHTEQKHT